MDTLPLTKLPNIGKTRAEKLINLRVANEFELKEIGSENAMIKIHNVDKKDTCINILNDLEDAIQGISGII